MKTLNLAADFPLLRRKIFGKRLIYLDSSATTQKPKAMIQALVNYYERENGNVHRGTYQLAQRATLAYEGAREVVAHFIGAETAEIIFTKNATESLNLLAYTLGKKLRPGEEIVLSLMEHHSNLVPWQQIARERRAVLKFLPLTKDYRLDLMQAKKMITAKTKIVSVVHLSNVLGTINPIREIAALAQAVGARLIVDAAQSVGHLPVNVRKLGGDFLAFSGHKLGGPTGIGVLYGKKELLEEMEPFLYGGEMIKEVTQEKATWNEVPWKFEAGTPPIAGAIGLAAAINYLDKVGLKKIGAHDRELAAYALKKLSALPFIRIIGPPTMKERGAVISFTVGGVHPHDVAEILDREGIAVRGGYLCAMPLFQSLKVNGAVRASFYLYNNRSDVTALVAGLKKVNEVFNR